MERDFDWIFEEENIVKCIFFLFYLKLLVFCKSIIVFLIWVFEFEVRKYLF